MNRVVMMPKLFLLAPLTVVTLALIACGGPDPEPESLAPAPTETPAPEPAPLPSEPDAGNTDPAATLAAFTEKLRAPGVDPDGLVISDIRYWEPDDERQTIELEVTTAWHSLEKTPRLDTAKALWELWATTLDPENYDHARIRLVSQGGTHVGGSQGISGASIYVDD